MLSRRKNFNQNRSRGCRSREAHCPGKNRRHRQDVRCRKQGSTEMDLPLLPAPCLPSRRLHGQAAARAVNANAFAGMTLKRHSRVRPGVPWPRRTSIASRSKAMRTATTGTEPAIWPSLGMTDFSPAALSHRISGQRKETGRSVTSIPCTVPGPDVPPQVPNSSASSPSPPGQRTAIAPGAPCQNEQSSGMKPGNETSRRP